ncbi:MAG: RNA methyltransferase [Alphaproteobacteria bacterium]|uniref:tRNA (cytidine/uridine-2'-O-)-methyltransferase TrmJ n=1 Tax=Candidatus Nitrobium versatile TaxID=2884831 RepID=A0A953M2Y9_9BACT|nr:RNA methyltransferase [Candidatus Nitrobium versatile]
MGNWKDNIYFILVEPREPGNIGATARAMKNMGFRNLCLVNPPPEYNDEAWWMARNAQEVLNGAERYDTLAEALRDKAIVVGIARRQGKRRGMSLPLETGVRKLLGMPVATNKVALLFGREDKGLYNEEVNECGFLLHIPSSKEQPSLNLSHAVMVVAYELSRTEYRKEETAEVRTPGASVVDAEGRATLVTHGELSFLFQRMADILVLLDYLPRGDLDLQRRIMDNLKYFIGRAGLTHWELKMLHGICSQIEKKLGG